ncbi:DNA polymerase III subunit beta [Ectothiorhodospiraceae bacterium 2226]|nr:DNA polymerase III subunit beta [Ectothiorhodospiraceae bacterium 2226]
MKLTIQREALLKPLQVVTGVVERRQTLPILSNVLMRVTESELALTGTDLEVEIITRTPLEGANGGETTLAARKFVDICRALPEGAEVEINVEGDRALIRSGRSRYTLTTLPAQEFPSLDELKMPTRIVLPQRELKSLIEKTHFSMAQQDVRYYLNGLLLEFSRERLRAVATDGHRLALADAALSVDVAEPRQIIVPRKGVLELVRLLGDTDEPAQLELASNHLRVTVGPITFTSKLVDGRFPDYNRVVPQGGDKIVLGDRSTLIAGLGRASVLSNEKFRGVRLQLGNDALRALVHNPEQEEAEDEMPVSYDGEGFEVGFNVQYLLDALAAVRSDQVRLVMSDANSSCLIQGDGDESSKYVIMPMRL